MWVLRGRSYLLVKVYFVDIHFKHKYKWRCLAHTGLEKVKSWYVKGKVIQGALYSLSLYYKISLYSLYCGNPRGVLWKPLVAKVFGCFNSYWHCLFWKISCEGESDGNKSHRPRERLHYDYVKQKGTLLISSSFIRQNHQKHLPSANHQSHRTLRDDSP